MLLFVLLGCKKQGEQVEEPSSKSISLDHRITANDIEQLNYTEFALSDLAEDATRDWLKFQELQTQIDILKKGDLSFFKDDKAILVSLLTDLKNEMPEAVNDPAVIVRLSVLETVMYKLEGLSTLDRAENDALLLAINGVITAHSNLIFQMNKKFEKEAQNVNKPL
jgi:hypothetical protein